ncbi:hypothetical protein K3495_g5755 [Podosphaera aphanis]|nr:hypothetical protein K3495_g5755 [Podosphaera aphanis]
MDRALDEIVAEHRGDLRYKGRRGGRRPERNNYSRYGVRKSIRDSSRNIDSEWVHDKFDDNTGRPPGRYNRRPSPQPDYDMPSAKLRVENLHYDLTEEDLDDLFNRIGPVLSLSLVYDRAGRSEGIAYVTYESSYHAKKAIREFDGANAKGQPIHLISIPSGPSGTRRNTTNAPRGSLFDRVTLPPKQAHQSSESRNSSYGISGSNIDRYTPGRERYSRSPRPRRRDGRRPGLRRVRGDRSGGGGPGGDRQPRFARPRKTQEELDAEMEDYWIGKNVDSNEAPAPTTAPPAVSTEISMDDQMIE